MTDQSAALLAAASLFCDHSRFAHLIANVLCVWVHFSAPALVIVPRTLAYTDYYGVNPMVCCECAQVGLQS